MTDTELLKRYSPYLQYDSFESFRADSAAVLTDHFLDDGAAWSHTNTLKRSGGSVLAAARPRPGQVKLELALLGAKHYANGATVRRGDYLDAVGREYVADARRMHAEARYADRIYGHAVRDSSGAIWLQYWFSYYYNNKNFLGIGLHEGDWEMIQIRLGRTGTPTVATFAQHNTGEAFTWSQLELRSLRSGPVPVVYVGRGSHALFASSGTHWPLPFPVPPDYANGKGPRVRPALEVITDNGPGWALWPGKWGSSDSSPRGPVDKGQWSDPAGFHEEVGGSLTRARPRPRAVPAAPPPAPPAPKIKVRRVEDRALVEYSFPKTATGAALPEQLVVSVDSPDDDLPPSTQAFDVKARTGAVVHPTRLADKRYVVQVVAYSEKGMESEAVSAKLARPR